MKTTVIFIILCWAGLLCSQSSAQQSSAELIEQGMKAYRATNFPEAMLLFTKSMKQTHAERDSVGYLKSIGYISNIYSATGDYGHAAIYLQKGYQTAVDQQNMEMQSRFLSNLVHCLAQNGKIDEAKYFLGLLKKAPGKDRINWQYYILYDLAQIVGAEGHLKEALLLHDSTLHFAIAHQMDQQYADFQNCEISRLLLRTGDYDRAIIYARRALHDTAEWQNKDMQASIYQTQAEAYQKLGYADSTKKYTALYLALADTIFNSKRLNQAGDELVEYENMMTKKHLSTLGKTIDQQTYIIIIVSSLLFILCFLLILLFRYNKRLRYAQRTLILKNRYIDRQADKQKQLLNDYLNKSEPKEICNAETTDGAEEEMKSEQEPNTVTLSDEQSKLILMRILDVMGRIDYISKTDFNMNMLAKLIGSNVKYVSIVINDTYNKNFKTFLNEYRIREACKRLNDTEHYGHVTIQAIYMEVGYTNSVSFNRAFKRVMGMAPSEYLKVQIQSPQEEKEE